MKRLKNVQGKSTRRAKGTGANRKGPGFRGIIGMAAYQGYKTREEAEAALGNLRHQRRRMAKRERKEHDVG